MLPTSGTFNFQSIQIELIIREAFERIGILGEFVEPQKLESAKRSIDLILLEWINKSINLWTIESTYLALVEAQVQYTLPATVNNIIQANLRTSTRQLNGTAASTVRQLGGVPASTSGVAANAFDGSPLTSCNQNPNADGNISYDYGANVTQTITIIGITSFVTRQYTISVETSVDNAAWVNLFNIPAQTYPAGETILFNVPAPLARRAYRIVETGGAVLNIQELYFENNTPNLNANNAFDGNSTTSCVQDIANGNISYDYGANVTQQINFVGIQSNADRAYSIIVESSIDNANWLPLATIPTADFVKDNIVWIDILIPIDARAYRIRETGGATLDIQEIYFNNNILDMPISNVSRYNYFTYPNKRLQSRPSVYYLHRKITPVLYLWPAPSNLYNCLQYSYTQMIQDTGAFYTNALQIPSRFYATLIWGLTYQLALKYNPQQAAQFKSEYEQSFQLATKEDSEDVPISIRGDSNYGGVY
jgi:hypothetical protein